MRNKLNITEEESKRILSLHNERIHSQKNIVSEESALDKGREELLKSGKKMVKNGVLTLSDDITLENSAGVSLANELKLFKGTKFQKVDNDSLVSDTKYAFVDSSTGIQKGDISKGKIRYSCSRKKFKILKTNSEDTYFNEDYISASEGFKHLCGLVKQDDQQKVQGGAGKPKPNTDGWGKLNKTNGTYTLRSNQPLKASVDFTTKFPKTIPAGTVVFHDYKKNDNKIILGNTGLVTYCNRNTFIYKDGIDDLKNDGLMGTLKGIFCNGDKIKTWKELTYTPVDNTGGTGGTNTGGTGGTNTGGTGGTGGTNTGGGSQTYPFNYQTVLNAFKQKFPEEDIINPFGQGGEEETQQIAVTDKVYGEL